MYGLAIANATWAHGQPWFKSADVLFTANRDGKWKAVNLVLDGAYQDQANTETSQTSGYSQSDIDSIKDIFGDDA